MVKRRASKGEVISRLVAAGPGGYVLIYVFAGTAALLPLHPADALFYPGLLSIALYVGIALWAFAARSHARVWMAIVAGCVACLVARVGLQAC
ncbi:hypothetical protein GCM10027565_23380 [Bordetella tumulicola]